MKRELILFVMAVSGGVHVGLDYFFHSGGLSEELFFAFVLGTCLILLMAFRSREA